MANVDSKENLVVAVYPQHSDAENAINLLKKSDFNIKKLAIVGQGYHTEDQVVGYYTAGDRMKHWKEGRILGWTLGPARRIRFLHHPRCRPGYGGRFGGGVGCGCSGECCCRRWFICAGGWALQHWNP